MAELMIIGWAVSPLISKLNEKAISYAKDQYKWIKGPTKSLEDLTSSLTRILATAHTVEMSHRQTQMKNSNNDAWLQQLKDAIYEIDDVLDEFSYLNFKSQGQPKVSRCLFNSWRTSKRMFGRDKPITKLKSLLQKLENIEKSSEKLVGVAILGVGVAALKAHGSKQVSDPAAAGSSAHPLTGSVTAENAKIGRHVENRDIISIVKENFSELPEQLQQCFAYCSIFPKNWKFDPKRLVQMWIAHDFIEPQGGENKSLEDLGLDYFHKLETKAFFKSLNPGQRTYYVIPDTIYEVVASSISTTECLRIEGDQSKDVPDSVRHLCVSTNRLLDLPNGKLKRLRTLVVVKNNSFSLKKIEEVLVKGLNSLRVLDLSNSDVTNLPENVGRMMHLRYLALCSTLNELPESIVDLLHLQTLYIPQACKIEMLPKRIKKLINMQNFDVGPKCIANISSIGGMVNLKCSVEFHVKNNNGHKLEELQKLDKINGKLTIKNLENVADGQESGKANLKKKSSVKVLNLEWSPGVRTQSWNVEYEVLENLKPHPNLQELSIMRYSGNKSPQWLGIKVLHNLKKIYLINCGRWEVLPPLGHLPALEILHVKKMHSVKKVGPDIYGTDEVAFPNLQELEFDDMPEWTEWSPGVNGLSFPNLNKIKITNCLSLDKVPPVPVAVMEIEAKQTGFVSYLKMHPYHPLKPGKLFLETSSLKICDELLCDEYAKYIEVLIICQCEEPVKAAAGYKTLANVERLRICQSGFVDNELKSLLQKMKGLVTLEIIGCPGIKTLQLPGEDNVLKELRVENCAILSSLVSLQSSLSVKSIMVERCPKFTLTSLPSDLKTLSSLKKFSVLHCPEFQSLPVDGFPQSLERFELVGCGLDLTKSLYVKEGSNWEKISGVPNVLVRY